MKDVHNNTYKILREVWVEIKGFVQYMDKLVFGDRRR